MAQSVKGLTYTHEDLSLDPQHSHTCQVGGACHLSSRRVERETGHAQSKLAGLANSVHSGFKSETLPQCIRQKSVKHQPLASTNMYTHMHVCPQAQVHTPT